MSPTQFMARKNALTQHFLLSYYSYYFIVSTLWFINKKTKSEGPRTLRSVATPAMGIPTSGRVLFTPTEKHETTIRSEENVAGRNAFPHCVVFITKWPVNRQVNQHCILWWTCRNLPVVSIFATALANSKHRIIDIVNVCLPNKL